MSVTYLRFYTTQGFHSKNTTITVSRIVTLCSQLSI